MNLDPTPLRILHSACLLHPGAGMLQQMQLEQDAATALNLPWRSVMYRPYSPQAGGIQLADERVHHRPDAPAGQKIRNWLALRRHYYAWLQTQDCDVHLLRYYVHDPMQLAFMRQTQKPVWLVHHSFEIPELALPGTLAARIRAALEQQIGRHCIARARGIIGVTPELADYEHRRGGQAQQPALIYPNGYAVGEQALTDRRSDEHIELLFVASDFYAWHGLDLLLASLPAERQPFVLHLVGRLDAQQQAQAAADPRIRIHGLLDTAAINRLAEQCWLGLSSFALFRKNMTQACTLKVREYLSQGLPVYSGHADVFPDDFVPYRHGPAQIGAILDFARQMRPLTRDHVRQAARPHIDKRLLLQQLYAQLATHSAA